MPNITYTPFYRGTQLNPKPVPIGIGEINLGFGNKILVTDDDHYHHMIHPRMHTSSLKEFGYASIKHLPLRLKDQPHLGLDLLIYILDKTCVSAVYDPYTADIDPSYTPTLPTPIWIKELKYVLDFNRYVTSDSDNFINHRYLYR